MDSSYILGMAQIIFWPLCALIAFMPSRWGIPAYLLLAQIDVTGPDFESATTIGPANTIKIIVLPTLLYLRLKQARSLEMRSVSFSRIWLAFVSYVALASLWTPFHLSALKMVGFLYAYSVLFVVFAEGWRAGWFSGRVITVLIWVSLLLAVAQTYLLGNFYGTTLGGSPYAAQFTTFIGAQSFAPFLLVLLVFQIVYGEGSRLRVLTSSATVVSIVLAGSRYVLGAGVLSLLVVYGGREIAKGNTSAVRTLVRTGIVTVSLGVVLGWAVIGYFPTSRVNELLNVVISRQGSLEDVADFAWRLQMYERVSSDLQTRGVGLLVTGSGTSSASPLKQGLDPSYDESTSDANRVVHNEFLRALYEWGVCGLALFFLFLVSVIKNSLTSFLRTKSPSALALLAALPALLIGLAIENVLSASGRPDGVGFTLALACFAASQAGASKETAGLSQTCAPRGIAPAFSQRI